MIKLMPHQVEVFNRFKDEDSGALFMDLGTGKTATAINLMKYNYEQKGHRKFLVFGPSAVLESWKNEIYKFWQDFPMLTWVSHGSDTKRKLHLSNAVKSEELVLIINYEAMASPTLRTILQEFKPDTLCLDESHRVKSHKAKRSKEILKIRKQAKACYLLTGTPILNDITDLFMQYNIMDLGKTFGSNFYVFQRKYMVDKNVSFKGSPNYFPKWEVRESMLPDIKQKMQITSVTMKKSDVLDLPPFIQKNYFTSLNKEQSKIYKELSKKLIVEIKEDKFITAENALTKVLRLNQICAGHLMHEGNVEHVFESHEKLDVCMEIVDKVVYNGEKIIIWCAFKADIKILTKKLKEHGHNYICFITGEQNSTQKAESMHTFQTDKRFNIMVANLSAGGTGITLTAASHAINFSRNYSLGDLLQSEARNYRKGSEIHSSIIQHNLVVFNSIEVDILNSLEKKKELGESLLDNLGKLKTADKEFKQNLLTNFIKGGM